MKNPKKPTRRQKILLDRLRLDPAGYLILNEYRDGIMLISRYTGQRTYKSIPEVLIR